MTVISVILHSLSDRRSASFPTAGSKRVPVGQRADDGAPWRFVSDIFSSGVRVMVTVVDAAPRSGLRSSTH